MSAIFESFRCYHNYSLVRAIIYFLNYLEAKCDGDFIIEINISKLVWTNEWFSSDPAAPSYDQKHCKILNISLSLSRN